jgi:hypothetical protein
MMSQQQATEGDGLVKVNAVTPQEPGDYYAYGSKDLELQQTTQFAQHDDPDVVIPDRISRALLWSSQLLVINGIVAYAHALFVLGTLLVVVWFTSILHWHKPRFSSPRRIIDYTAVATLVGYSTYFSTTLSTMYMLVWFIGLGCIAIIFTLNETAFYLQIGKTPPGDDDDTATAANSLQIPSQIAQQFPYAPPNTKERDWVFKRCAYVHLFAVHVVANVLALAIILGSQA